MIGILLNSDGSLKVENGSLVIGDTTVQNQQLLLLAEKGEFKPRPMRGVGARRYLEGSQPDELAREIRTELTLDGMKVKAIVVKPEGELLIDASYDN